MSEKKRWAWAGIENLNIAGSVVYFVQAGDAGPVKIGVAGNMASRMYALQVGNHERLWLIGYESGSFEKEAEYHAKFSKHHIHGEWYRPDQEIINVASELASTAPPSVTKLEKVKKEPVIQIGPRIPGMAFSYCQQMMSKPQKDRPEYFQRLVTENNFKGGVHDVLKLVNYHLEVWVEMKKLSYQFKKENKTKLKTDDWPIRFAYVESHRDPNCERMVGPGGVWNTK